MSEASQPIHCGLVIASMRTGGAERAFVNLGNGLAQSGCVVDMILVEKTGAFLEQISEKIVVCNLNSKRASKGVKAFRRYLTERNPDVIIVAQLHVQVMALAAARQSGWKGKIILNEQSSISRNAFGWKRKFQVFLLKRWINRADAIAVVSKGAADDYVEVIPSAESKVCVIYNPIISAQSEEKLNETLSHDFFGKSTLVITAVGRLTASKRFDLLLDAFTKVRKQMECKLIIAGEGEERANLEMQIRKLGIEREVSLQGETKNSLALFRQSNLAVLSSDYEGLPAVLIEAMYADCPVVSTDCPHGPKEILDNGKYGRLVPVGDARKLSDAILNELKSPLQVNRKLRAQNFSVENCVKSYRVLFENLLSR